MKTKIKVCSFVMAFAMMAGLMIPQTFCSAASASHKSHFNVVISDRTASYVTLNWDNVKGCKKYAIKQKVGSKWKTVKTTKETKAKLDTNDFYSDYKFRVIGNKTSSKATVTVPSAYRTMAPVAFGMTDTSIDIQWTKVPGASTYKVFIYADNTWTKIGTVDTNKFHYSGDEIYKSGIYKVVAAGKNIYAVFTSPAIPVKDEWNGECAIKEGE